MTTQSDEPDLDRVRFRFLRHVRLHAGVLGCWLWPSSPSDERGRFLLDGKVWMAHRASYFLFVGEIPQHIDVLHLCDVRCCVSPAHLYLGRDSDNVADRQKRGRSRGRWSKSPKVVGEPLTDLQFIERFSNDPHRIFELMRAIRSVIGGQGA